MRKAIANDKAAGIDSIQAELINAGDETAVATLTELCNKVWDTEIVPDDWKDSVIVIVPLPVENRHFRLTLLYGTLRSPLCRRNSVCLLSSVYDGRNFAAYSQGLTFRQYFCTG